MTTYTLYIDESGETGLSKVRTEKTGGASPYLTLGAALVQDNDHDTFVDRLAEIAKAIGKKTLHCSTMKHQQKVFYAREIAKEEVLCFGVISLKETLGSYKADISSDGTKYFNKCAQYLLERVGEFMKEHDIPSKDLRIIFEEGHHDYARFRSFINMCQRYPKHPKTRLLQQIEVGKITDAPKDKEPLLQIADLVAHALFKAVDKAAGNYFIPEPRYLNELNKRFYSNKGTGMIIGAGIMPIHTLKQLKLDSDVHALLEAFKT